MEQARDGEGGLADGLRGEPVSAGGDARPREVEAVGVQVGKFKPLKDKGECGAFADAGLEKAGRLGELEQFVGDGGAIGRLVGLDGGVGECRNVATGLQIVGGLNGRLAVSVGGVERSEERGDVLAAEIGVG